MQPTHYTFIDPTLGRRRDARDLQLLHELLHAHRDDARRARRERLARLTGRRR